MEKSFEVLSEPAQIFDKMLFDINKASKSILIENYIWRDDKIGRQFLDALIKNVKAGVKVKILLDAWGSYAVKDGNFFDELQTLGGEVRFFREFRYVFRIISKNNERNHRKILIVDDKICYFGSINISSDFLSWRELVLKIKGPIILSFKKAFYFSWKRLGKLDPKRVLTLVSEEFSIIQDVPSLLKRYTEKSYVLLINNAEREILIETPYFVPSYGIRKALLNAVNRGVTIRLILPRRSNWKIVDIIRNRYLGVLSLRGVKLYYYLPRMLHSKLMIVDNSYFILGSSNLDYRSLVHNYEINLLGKDKKLISSLRKYFYETFKDSREFGYREWKARSSFLRILELILGNFKRFV